MPKPRKKKTEAAPEQPEKSVAVRQVGEKDAAGRVWDGRRWLFGPSNPCAWPKGKSGNPAGRPPRRRLGDDLGLVLLRPATDEQREEIAGALGLEAKSLERSLGLETITFQVWLAVRTVERAGAGNLEAFREIFDRADPKPKRLEITTPPDQPFTVAAVRRAMDDREASERYGALVRGGTAP